MISVLIFLLYRYWFGDVEILEGLSEEELDDEDFVLVKKVLVKKFKLKG